MCSEKEEETEEDGYDKCTAPMGCNALLSMETKWGRGVRSRNATELDPDLHMPWGVGEECLSMDGGRE